MSLNELQEKITDLTKAISVLEDTKKDLQLTLSRKILDNISYGLDFAIYLNTSTHPEDSFLLEVHLNEKIYHFWKDGGYSELVYDLKTENSWYESADEPELNLISKRILEIREYIL